MGALRVGLSMLNLVPGEIGGAERYAVELARALTESGVDTVSLVPPAARGALSGTHSVAADVPDGAGGTSKLRRMLIAWLRPGPLRRQLGNVDVVHYPLTVPVPSVRLPWVTTLHDVQHRDLPLLFSRAKRAYRRLAYERAARNADAVIVVSEFVRERAIACLDLDPGSVHVIPHGIDHAVFHPVPGERQPFLLYPARPWPHKNHARLYEAFALLRAEQPELELVLTGGGHTGPVPDGVEVRGQVSDDELAALYRRAACLVFPSLYEGFGLPPLEAMACGCPVAASNRGALPEVCGGSAVLFDPEDPAAIAAGVREALERAHELSRRGIEHAAGFTWAAVADRHRLVYETVAGR